MDEAQKIHNVGNILKSGPDKIKEVSVMITGSSSFKLAYPVNVSLSEQKQE